ncbi:hypothetical protein VTL71DRAFT_8327 [Oculimacula yallundae]|uniref:2EXR domain-containing protein n=1 Tax=Oculimacula yallundae TaxID=86028 RepID=A0ABR4CXA6_9HELO
MASSSPQAGEFTLFGELRTELRLKIWELSLPGPRIVFIEVTHSNGSLGTGFSSPCPRPNLLLACKESYDVASKHYEQAFGTDHALPQIWFDFHTDVLYLDYDWPRISDLGLSELECGKVRHLAILETTVESFEFEIEELEDYEDYLSAFVLPEFPNLKRLTISKHGPFHTRKDAAHLLFADVGEPGDGMLLCKPIEDAEDESEDEYEAEHLRELRYFESEYDFVDREGFIDIEKLNMHRRERLDVLYHSDEEDDGGHAEVDLPPLPIIDHKIITTPSILKDILRSRPLDRDEPLDLALRHSLSRP